jgi:hypothetical protein
MPPPRRSFDVGPSVAEIVSLVVTSAPADWPVTLDLVCRLTIPNAYAAPAAPASPDDAGAAAAAAAAASGGRTVDVTAAAPPERRGSFTGSCLPFPDARRAIEASPNVFPGLPVAPDGSFRVDGLLLPNSFYAPGGTVRVPPSLFVSVNMNSGSGRHPLRGRLELPEEFVVPFRGLTYDPRRVGPEFYGTLEDHRSRLVSSQPALLAASGYPERKRE